MKSGFLVGSIVALVLALAAVPASFAADKDKPEPRSTGLKADPTARLRAALDDMKLTGDTKKKVDDILAKTQADIAKAQNEAGNDRQAAAAKIGELTRSAAVEIAGALDDDQRAMLQSKLRGAAGGGEGGPRGGDVTARLKANAATLGLSEEQNKKFDATMAQLQKRLDEIRASGGDNPQEKFQALRDDIMAQIKANFSESQFAKFQEQMQQGGGGAGGGMRAGAGLARFQEAVNKLDLSADQKTKLDSAFAAAKKQIEEIAPQVQGGQPTPEIREKLGQVMKDLQSQLGTILTEDQQEKLRASMPQPKPAKQ